MSAYAALLGERVPSCEYTKYMPMSLCEAREGKKNPFARDGPNHRARR
jgi:hypothetical protein